MMTERYVLRLFVAGMGHRVYEWDLTKLRGELQKLGLDWE